VERAYWYGVLLKPKVLLAMLALYISCFFSSFWILDGRPLDVAGFLAGLVAVAAAVSGANALNCYIDRDIDALMARTLGRPLVLRTVEPSNALWFGGVMLLAAAFLSLSLGLLPFVLFLEGCATYLVLYTGLLKRSSKLNVLATAPSVAAPAWFGWYMGGAPFYPLGLLMGCLVALWGPLHLWSLSYAYSKDYLDVGVPMLPVTVYPRHGVLYILTTAGLLVAASYALVPWTNTPIYAIGVSALNGLLVLIALRFRRSMSRKDGWILFKVTAPYIVVVLLLFMFDLMLSG
jgi:protoheme IX farnesyltransferase